MGQRLNLEIWNNGKVLAGGYYHWSAYTCTSAETVDAAMNSMKLFDPADNEVLYAIRLLEATGAGLTEDEVQYLREQEAFKDCEFKECRGRNLGLISVTEEGIRETRNWEEGTARIYLDEKRISFAVFWTERGYDWERQQREDYGIVDANHRELPTVDFNFDDIKFDRWAEVSTFLKDVEDPFKSTVNPYEVILPIY